MPLLNRKKKPKDPIKMEQELKPQTQLECLNKIKQIKILRKFKFMNKITIK